MSTLSKNIGRLIIIIHLVCFLLYFLITIYSQSAGYYQLILSRGFLVIAIFGGIILLFNNRKNLQGFDFAPMGLSLLRIVFFGIFFCGGVVRYQYMNDHFIFFSRFINPQNLPDHFSRSVWNMIPYTHSLITAAFFLLIFSAFFSMIGLKTKWAIGIFTLVSLYLFSIPNLTGKINHNHDLFWIPAILIFSGCEHYFSIDALLKKKRWKSKPFINPVNYNIPAIAIWLILGICYFFPGFWKMWNCGLDWALTDNLKYLMFDKWNSTNHFVPVFRVDRYPLVYKFLGLCTMWFEISFIFLLPYKRLRNIVLLIGILFHIGTWLFLDIFFVFFLIAYLPLFNLKRFTKSKIEQSTNPKSFLIKKPFFVISSILILGFFSFGIFRLYSWPFACYPRFDSMFSPTIKSISIFYCPTDKSCYELDKAPVQEKYSPERLAHLENTILMDVTNSNDRLEELSKIYMEVYKLKDNSKMMIYENINTIDPDNPHLSEKILIKSF